MKQKSRLSLGLHCLPSAREKHMSSSAELTGLVMKRSMPARNASCLKVVSE